MTNEEIGQVAWRLQTDLVLLRPQFGLTVEAVGTDYTRAAYGLIVETARSLVSQAYEEAAQTAEGKASHLNHGDYEFGYDAGVLEAAKDIRALKESLVQEPVAST